MSEPPDNDDPSEMDEPNHDQPPENPLGAPPGHQGQWEGDGAPGIFAGSDVATETAYRETLHCPFYDTLLYPGKMRNDGPWLVPHQQDPANNQVCFRLFSSAENIGWRNLTNLNMPGCFGNDQVYEMYGLRCKIWTDRTNRWQSGYPLADSVSLYEMIVGNKPQGIYEIKHEPLTDEQHRVFNGEMALRKTIHIPARQNFNVNLYMPLTTVQEIHKQIEDGARFLWRVTIDGILARDIA